MTMINCERFIWFYWWCCCHSCNPLGLLAFCSFSLPVTWTQFLGRREFVLKETWCFQLTTGYLNCMYFLVSCRIWFYLFYQHSPRSSRFQPVFPWPQMLKPSHSRVYSFQRKVQSAREKTSGPLLIRPPLTHKAHFGIGLYIYIEKGLGPLGKKLNEFFHLSQDHEAEPTLRTVDAWAPKQSWIREHLRSGSAQWNHWALQRL